jgi:Kef-type K+ transport system membrane component KefB
VIAAARVMGAVFRRIGQPAVLGEITAGVLLGPTVLGAFPGDLTGCCSRWKPDRFWRPSPSGA